MSADLVTFAREVYGPRPPECRHCGCVLRSVLGGMRDCAGQAFGADGHAHQPDHVAVPVFVAPSPDPGVDAMTFADQVAQVTRAADARRVSHRELMKATEWLAKASQKEQDAGETNRAMEINGLCLAVFKAAIRVEDLEPGS